tara:strand:+ start:854 stop:1090 length:237 start_codon:yes stop_codon:yes gene_type:complete
LNDKTWELLPFWFPQSKNNKIWTSIFILIFILSIDIWNWNSNTRLFEWLPIWIIYLIVVQFALAYSVWKFSKEWKIDE